MIQLLIQEIEYRTIEWGKDALYFSYEPNFLFLGKLSIIWHQLMAVFVGRMKFMNQQVSEG